MWRYNYMDKKTAVKKIWGERFGDSREWMDMVFSRIYSDDVALTLDVDGDTVSSLLLRRLQYRHLGAVMPVSYIYGAATLRKRQGQGFMSRLMNEAVMTSHSRGDVISFLRPAQKWLFDFYAQFGYTPAVLVDEQRYTAAHIFETFPDRYNVETTVYDIEQFAKEYDRLSLLRPSTMLHDVVDFKTILIDNSIDGGVKAVVTDKESGAMVAVAFATVKDGETLNVSDLLATDDETAMQALWGIRQQIPDMMIVVDAWPERKDIDYTPKAMVRIINVEKFFELIADRFSRTPQQITVHDRIIDENNATFIVSKGRVSRVEQANEGNGADQLDVDIEVLTSIMFSSLAMGDIFGLPSTRPYISLLLD